MSVTLAQPRDLPWPTSIFCPLCSAPGGPGNREGGHPRAPLVPAPTDDLHSSNLTEPPPQVLRLFKLGYQELGSQERVSGTGSLAPYVQVITIIITLFLEKKS